MIVEEHNVITITYELREGGPRGELMERMDVNYPFKFLFGTDKLLPAFEANLYGLAADDSFAFTLPPEEAYGPVEAGNIIDVPRSAFQGLGENFLIKGNCVTLTDDLGEAHNGRILSWDDHAVKVDFNHAMAGRTLHFAGTVLHIRKATVDELVRRHYIEEDGLRRPDFGEENDQWWRR